jgi:MoaA/NifB/PqqE/SkfB family radical SAM enzyme
MASASQAGTAVPPAPPQAAFGAAGHGEGRATGVASTPGAPAAGAAPALGEDRAPSEQEAPGPATAHAGAGPSPSVAVVVNTYGDKRLPLVKTTLTTLRRTVDWDRARLVVVDTAGSPAKREFLATFADVLVCVDDAQFGEGAGWNLGVRHALELGAQHVAMVNDDICFHAPGWLEECVGKLERHPELAVMTPYGHVVDGRLAHPQFHGDHVYGHHNVGRLRDEVWIRNRVPFQVWVFGRRTYERFGPFQEVAHGEQKGWVHQVCPDSQAVQAIRAAGLCFGATEAPSAEHTGLGPGVSYWQHQQSRFDSMRPTAEFSRLHASVNGPDPQGLRVYQIELTNRCPFTCVMCPRSEMTRPLGVIDETLFQRVADQLGDHQGRPLYLHHFGESLLHPRFAALARYAADRGIKTHVSCNPNLMTERRAEEILASGLASIMFSIDGMTNATFQGIRGKAAEIEAAKRNVENFMRRRAELGHPIEVAFQMIDLKANRSEQPEFVRYFSRYASQGARVSLKAFDTFNNPEKAHLSDRYLEGRCTIPFDHMTVLWDGRVVPCCHDEDGYIVLGDANRQSLAEIWRSPVYQRFRAGYLEHPYCRLCSWR